VIPNDRLKYATDQKVTMFNAFEIADEVLHQAVTSISDLIKNNGFINLDFADVTTIMKDAATHIWVWAAQAVKTRLRGGEGSHIQPAMETSIDGAGRAGKHNRLNGYGA
jgi:cell division protein FtsZ